jgi:hypothetical protein
MRSIGFRGFRLVGPEVILGFVLILGALVVFLTVMTLVAAAFYNLLGTGRRGVRIRTSVVHPQPARAEQEAEPARPVVIEPAAAPHEDGDEDGDEGEGEGEAKPAAAAG